MRKNKKENGRTMVEMIGVISIVGLLTISVFTGYGYVISLLNKNNLEDIIMKSVLAVRGGKIQRLTFVENFIQDAGNYDVEAKQINCSGNDANKYNYCIQLTFTNLDAKVVNMLKNDKPQEFNVLDKSSNSTLIISFGTRKFREFEKEFEN